MMQQTTQYILATLSIMLCAAAMVARRIYCLQNENDSSTEHRSQQLNQIITKKNKEIQLIQKNHKLLMREVFHGLQTPLTVIKGEMDLYGAKKSNKQTSFFRQIDRLTGYICKLSQFSNLNLESTRKKMKKIDLSALVANFCEYVQTNCEYEKICFTQTIRYNSARIIGNEQSILEILALIANLHLKTMAKKDILAVELKKYRSSAQIKISSQTQLPNNVMKSVESDNQNKLELAIINAIVQNHNGSIKLKQNNDFNFSISLRIPVL
ncbi:MAG: hypothetical protein ABH832_02985 [bacterium]